MPYSLERHELSGRVHVLRDGERIGHFWPDPKSDGLAAFVVGRSSAIAHPKTERTCIRKITGGEWDGTGEQAAPREPGRLSPTGDDVRDLDPATLAGDGTLTGGTDPESLIHDNRIRAATGLRVLREHGSPADNVDQALADVLVDLLHLGDLLGADPGWVEDAREHHRKEITGDY